MVIDHKANLMLQLLLLLSFTYVLLSASAPTTSKTGSININKDDLLNLNQDSKMEVLRVASVMEIIDRRIGLETMDYSEVGANPGHDHPITPPERV